MRVGDIRNLWIYSPAELDEQKKIAALLNAACGKIESEVVKLHKLQKQKAGLMHDLLTGKVPVTVDTVTKEAADVQN